MYYNVLVQKMLLKSRCVKITVTIQQVFNFPLKWLYENLSKTLLQAIRT